MQTDSPAKNSFLSGIRGFAILITLTSHLTWGYVPDKVVYVWVQAMELFFAMTGILITSHLINSAPNQSRIAIAISFYRKRALRIFPPLMIYLLVLFGLSQLDVIHVFTKELWASLFLFRPYISEKGWYTGHLWTLTIQQVFYLLAPVLFLTFRRNTLKWLLPSLCLSIALWRGLDTHFGIFSAYFPASNPIARFDTRLDGILWASWFVLITDGKLRTFLPISGTPIWIGIGAWILTEFLPFPYDLTIQSILVPWLVLTIARNPAHRIHRLFSIKPFLYIGEISYSLYIWQELFLAHEKSKQPALKLLQTFPVNIGAAFLVAFVSFRLLEKPFTQRSVREVT